jgi:predicted enzyme related to lactoylglutathione lyase
MTVIRARLLQIAPQISVPDVRATAQWYCDVLGFSIDSIYPEDQPDAAVISRDEAAIVLDRSARGLAVPNHERHGVGYDAYISVDHLDELAGEFRDRGARIIDGPVNRPYGVRELVVEDVNGFHLAFAETP